MVIIRTARIEALEAALAEIEKARPEMTSNHDYSRGWNDALFLASQIARRAREGGKADG